MVFLNLIPPIPIPVTILNIALTLTPVLIAILSTSLQIQDYLFSFAFLRAGNLLSSCCDSYDFIVIGSGSAGAVIAARLSETVSSRVLLIEAGGSSIPLFNSIPAAAPALTTHPSTDWGYKTVPQNGSAFGFRNREVIWPRGKGLGGSSNTNFMIYMNGNARDFDRWAEHTGDSRWGFKNMEKYFRAVEDYQGIWDGITPHSKGGPLRVEPVRYHPGLNFVMQAAKELGYEIRDPNYQQKVGLLVGFAPLDFTIKRGSRMGTYQAYLLPAFARPNLSIYKYTLATKIHFNDLNRAVGVSFLRHGIPGYAIATKEIIVCGGAINSPQLLLLSGLGPRRHLQELGIPLIKHLPGVGENLQDHVTTGIGPFLLNQKESFLLERDMTLNSLLSYVKNGDGPLSVPGALIAIGAISSIGQNPSWPDIMSYVENVGLSPLVVRLLEQMFGSGTVLEEYLRPDFGKDAHFVLVTLGLPKSRGVIRLRNRDPTSKPFIDPRYFSDRNGDDIRRLREGVEVIVRMYENTTAFRQLSAHMPSRPIPGCEGYRLKSPEYFECHIRVVTFTLYHPTSTCAMGKPENPYAVVDPQLRVIGVKGLRVADASIMPYVTNANTNSPTIVIGEMCADMIKETWNLR